MIQKKWFQKTRAPSKIDKKRGPGVKMVDIMYDMEVQNYVQPFKKQAISN